MPLYAFYSEKKDEYRDVFFHMNDDKVYSGEDGTEIGEWRRVYTVPQCSIDTKLDPRDQKTFIRRTEKYKTVGDLQSKSRELSEARTQNDGVDTVREQYFAEYSKARKGARHPESLPKKIDTPNVTVDLS